MPNLRATTAGVFCLLLVAALAGCDGPTYPISCPDRGPGPAIRVIVLHADTNEPIDDALAIAEDGAFVDSARSGVHYDGQPRPAALATERPGTYEVTVEKEGFSTWKRSGVEITEGLCGAKPVALIAGLVPYPTE